MLGGREAEREGRRKEGAGEEGKQEGAEGLFSLHKFPWASTTFGGWREALQGGLHPAKAKNNKRGSARESNLAAQKTAKGEKGAGGAGVSGDQK